MDQANALVPSADKSNAYPPPCLRSVNSNRSNLKNGQTCAVGSGKGQASQAGSRDSSWDSWSCAAKKPPVPSAAWPAGVNGPSRPGDECGVSSLLPGAWFLRRPSSQSCRQAEPAGTVPRASTKEARVALGAEAGGTDPGLGSAPLQAPVLSRPWPRPGRGGTLLPALTVWE